MLVMSGFGGGQAGLIELLDLDTIDLSNLNRQFLFQKHHVKRPKAVVSNIPIPFRPSRLTLAELEPSRGGKVSAQQTKSSPTHHPLV